MCRATRRTADTPAAARARRWPCKPSSGAYLCRQGRSLQNRPHQAALVIGLAPGSSAVSAQPAKQTLVVCSPGSPGTTDEAQPRMDTFAAAVSAKTGIPLQVIYEPTEHGGASHLKTAAIGLVSLPFF